MMNLERLETRTVLSNVTVQFPAPFTTSTLLITGDTQNDNFVITENTDGSVTVSPGTLVVKPGVGVIPGSAINGNSAPVSTNNPVSAIQVLLPGQTNFDIVNLNGQSAAASPTVGPVTVTATNTPVGGPAAGGVNLTFNVGVTGLGVHNSGPLTVSDINSLPSNGVLNATVQNSSFTSMSITQQGNGPDFSSVTLTNDTVPGPVSVSLGFANNDKITLTNNPVFGITTLLEGNGDNGIAPAGLGLGTSAGAHDSISVVGPAAPGSSHYTELLAQQDAQPVPPGGGNNTNETITVNNIQVAYIAGTAFPGPGVTTIQGNGAFDTTTVNLVTTFKLGPIQNPIPGTGFANISVTQGTGSVGLPNPPAVGVNDQASITNSNVPGFMSITQSDAASNSPSYNTALISNDVAGGALSITQGNAGGTVLKGPIITPGDQATITGSSAGGNASISQGSGANDSAAILSSTVKGSASITQTDVSGNPGDTAMINGDTVTGSDTITQGAANNDVAQIVGGTAGGSATISQLGGAGDQATIMLTSIGGNAKITQGGGASDIAQILGTSSAPGTIGGDASISQLGGAGDVAVIAYETIGTANTALGNINISQGDGVGDAAEIENVTDPGGDVKHGAISIGITQGNGNHDIAAIVNLVATGGAVGAPDNIFITQGSGNADSTHPTTDPTGNDWAEIANVNVPNASGVPAPAIANITITQGDVASNQYGNTAYVLNAFVGVVTAGNTDNNGTGNVAIFQGDAPGDVALVEGGVVIGGTATNGVANNVTISQGSNGGVNGTLPGFNGSTIASNIAEVNDETVTSNITITQGNSNSFGYNVAAIGYDYLGYLNMFQVPSLLSNAVQPPLTAPSQFTALAAPTAGSSSVTAGGITSIQQFGANNQVFLGDVNDFFYSTFLDVYTGGGGGALVVAQNTYTLGVAALGGPFSAVYNVESGGSGNQIYLDPAVSAFYVTFDPASFIYLG
jgi:hypothetical protein